MEAALLVQNASLAMSNVVFQKNTAGRHGLVHVTRGASSRVFLNTTEFLDNQAQQYPTISKDSPEVVVYSAPQALPVSTLHQPIGNDTAYASPPNGTEAATFLPRNTPWLQQNLQVP
jgi:hypothetical protein